MMFSYEAQRTSNADGLSYWSVVRSDGLRIIAVVENAGVTHMDRREAIYIAELLTAMNARPAAGIYVLNNGAF